MGGWGVCGWVGERKDLRAGGRPSGWAGLRALVVYTDGEHTKVSEGCHAKWLDLQSLNNLNAGKNNSKAHGKQICVRTARKRQVRNQNKRRTENKLRVCPMGRTPILFLKFAFFVWCFFAPFVCLLTCSKSQCSHA